MSANVLSQIAAGKSSAGAYGLVATVAEPWMCHAVHGLAIAAATHIGLVIRNTGKPRPLRDDEVPARRRFATSTTTPPIAGVPGSRRGVRRARPNRRCFPVRASMGTFAGSEIVVLP